jgi:cytochrome c553
MTAVVANLTDDDFVAIGAYLASRDVPQASVPYPASRGQG